MKKVNKYQTTESFNSDSERLNSYDNFVALDKQENKIYTKKQGPQLHDASIVGDIVMYDKQGAKMVHCKPSKYSQDAYPDSQYTPIGIVIIPSSHTDDRKDVIISLAAMSAQTPDNGVSTLDELQAQGNDALLRFGGQGRQLSGFSKNGKIPYIASCPKGGELSDFGSVQFEVISEDMSNSDNHRACIYSNNELKGTANPYNPNEGYYTTTINDAKKKYKVLLMPSPYTSNGGKNPEYFQAPGDGGNNILADFDGSVINKKYLEQIEGDEEWKTSPTISNYDKIQFPYIQCCWRYHTEGTNQGDWYVPSAGEIGYICAKSSEIQAGYNKMKEVNKTFINLIDIDFGPSYINVVTNWVSNYNSDTYGFTFESYLSILRCDSNGYYGKNNSSGGLSIAACRVSL